MSERRLHPADREHPGADRPVNHARGIVYGVKQIPDAPRGRRVAHVDGVQRAHSGPALEGGRSERVISPALRASAMLRPSGNFGKVLWYGSPLKNCCHSSNERLRPADRSAMRVRDFRSRVHSRACVSACGDEPPTGREGQCLKRAINTPKDERWGKGIFQVPDPRGARHRCR